MSTPNYVKEAVLAYMERNNIEPLAQMFENGIPLHLYQESCEIIAKRIRGESIKKRGKQPLTRDQLAKQDEALMFVAQLHGAGFGIYTEDSSRKTESTTPIKPSACDIAAKKTGLTASHIYISIWKPRQDSDLVKVHMEIGAANKTSFFNLFIDWN